MLKSLVDPSRQLTEEQQNHIDSLQDDIDEIWNRRGNYQIDTDAWESMPMFMEHISEDDIAQNASCAALASIVYDEVPPDEVAENRKVHGNRALNLALNPAQERRDNLARAACHSYTEALQCKGKDPRLSSTIYANRSLAQFIMGNYGHGLEDAQRAIVLQPNYHKAYYRGAKCAEKLRKYNLALNLLHKGRTIDDPPLDAAGQDEFDTLENAVRAGMAVANEQLQSQRRKQRSRAVAVSNLACAIRDRFGIVVDERSEVTSDQMGVYGNPQPYFDEEDDGVLHVPVLFMYDEYAQTDMLNDVSVEATALDLLNELMPFPWDDTGRYCSADDIVVFYKIDDAVHDPMHYEVNKNMPLIDVFRRPTYRMPGLLPVLHAVCKSSDLIQRFHVERV